MTTKKCPHCDEVISQEEKICPICYESVEINEKGIQKSNNIKENIEIKNNDFEYNEEKELVLKKIIEAANEGREEGNKFEYIKSKDEYDNENEDEEEEEDDDDDDDELPLPSEILRQIKENIAESYWILYRVENFKMNLKTIFAYQKITLLTQLKGTNLRILYLRWNSDELEDEGEIDDYNKIDDYIEIMEDVHEKLGDFFKVDEDEDEDNDEE